MEYLNELNPQQRQAAEYTQGPELILAGAGSGKTRVITYKIAYLVRELGYFPHEILALTFTNKAAAEMRSRVEQMLNIPCEQLWISTFHSFTHKVLQRHIERHSSYRSRFLIYDDSDKISALKTLLKRIADTDIPFEREKIDFYRIGQIISRAKTQLIVPGDFLTHYTMHHSAFYQYYYQLYDELLKQNNALDFDDLLKVYLEIMKSSPDLLELYQNQFRYVLVDEYQDTNYPQYLIVRQLSEKHQHLCVVGDDDQSIYSWRGADIRNILEFESDFPDAEIFKLEQNYRSTQTILAAASHVVNRNKNRKRKELWTEGMTGEPLSVFTAANEHEEARFLVTQIYKEVTYNYRAYSDIAIFYRTNAQSRILEEYCRRFEVPIPYTIIGGFRFYERKEVKDLLSYLSVLYNPDDTLAFLRIINEPKRGIGDATLDKLLQFRSPSHPSLYRILSDASLVDQFSPKIKKKLQELLKIIEAFRLELGRKPLGKIIQEVDNAVGYSMQYENDLTVENQSRLDNINELLNAVYDYEERNESVDIGDFLNQIRLQSDIDRADLNNERITMMTIHCAKGLEFPVVFVCGMEDGLFPLHHNQNNPEDIEEERRLFYVALTRAKEKVYLSMSKQKRWRNNFFDSQPSSFLYELPQDMLEQLTYY